MLSTGASVENLSVVYSTSHGDLPALGPITLDIGPSEFVALLGPSGCGKSTLLKVLAGLLDPASGTARIAGGAPRPGDVGIVFQKPTLLPWKNVRDNVLVPLQILGTCDQSGIERADRLLALVGLGTFARHYPHELSGGMQQRVAIARALINEPKLLLMDEPFAALDALTREQMMIELQSIWESAGTAVVLVTHSIQEAAFMADRVVTLSARPARIRTVEQISLSRPRSLKTMASPDFAAICDRLRRSISGIEHG
jgi:NitT/TauT family transport system ATP-binding protein